MTGVGQATPISSARGWTETRWGRNLPVCGASNTVED
jgi:hypothetical protein